MVLTMLLSVQCTNGLEYTSCIKTCSKCHYLEPDCVETAMCQAGCDCPYGMVYDGSSCIYAVDCMCQIPGTDTLLNVRMHKINICYQQLVLELGVNLAAYFDGKF